MENTDPEQDAASLALSMIASSFWVVQSGLQDDGFD
jgi:hypothetical protein